MDTPLGHCAECDHPTLYLWLWHCQHVGTRLVEVVFGSADVPYQVPAEWEFGPFDTVEEVMEYLDTHVRAWWGSEVV